MNSPVKWKEMKANSEAFARGDGEEALLGKCQSLAS